jgi:hypothetical protein
VTLVGRDDRCRIRLRSEDVSDVHCALVATPLGAWVVDLLSREGTFLNDKFVRRGPLRDESEVRVGPFLLRFVSGTPPEDDPGQRSGTAAPLVRFPVVSWGGPTTQAVLPSSRPAAESLSPSGEGRGPDPSWVPVLNQFHQMQQQMFEQFQQTVLVMLQLFSSMHHDQTALIREELARLHAVTHELEILQKRIAEEPPRAAGPEAAGAVAKQPAPASQSAALPSGARNGERGRRPTPEKTDASGGSVPVTPADIPAVPEGLQPGEDIHAWLKERVATLEQERQGRWQKILSLFGVG